MNILHKDGLCIDPSSSDEFLVRAVLEGRHTLESMEQVSKGILPSVISDIRHGAYKVLVLSPEECSYEERDLERLWQKAVIASLVHGGGAFLADSREEGRYNGTVWHTHPNSLTTALTTKSGELPTIFVRDQNEFMQSVSDTGLLSLLAENPTDLSVDTRDPVSISNALLRVWSLIPSTRQTLRERIDTMKSSITGLASVAPKIGSVSFFGQEIVHASGIIIPNTEPGDLYVSQHSLSSIQS